MAMLDMPGDDCGMSISFPFSEEDLVISGHEDGIDWWKIAMPDEDIIDSFLTGSVGGINIEGSPLVYKRKSKSGTVGIPHERFSSMCSPRGDQIRTRLRKVQSEESKSVGVALNSEQRPPIGRDAAERRHANSEKGHSSAVQVPSRRKVRAAGKEELRKCSGVSSHKFVKKRKLALVADCNIREPHTPIPEQETDDGCVLLSDSGRSLPSRSTRSRHYRHHVEQRWGLGFTTELARFQRKKRLLLPPDCGDDHTSLPYNSVLLEDAGLTATWKGCLPDSNASARSTRGRPKHQNKCNPSDYDSAGNCRDVTPHKVKLVSLADFHDWEGSTSLELHRVPEEDGELATTRGQQRGTVEGQVRSSLRNPLDTKARKEKLLSALDADPGQASSFGVPELEGVSARICARGLDSRPKSSIWQRQQNFQECREAEVDALADNPQRQSWRKQQPVGDCKHQEAGAPLVSVDPMKSNVGPGMPSRSSEGCHKHCQENQEAQWGPDNDIGDATDDQSFIEQFTMKSLSGADCHNREISPPSNNGDGNVVYGETNTRVDPELRSCRRQEWQGEECQEWSMQCDIPYFQACHRETRTKKKSHLMRKGLRKPKRSLALKQLFVRLPPVQKRVGAVDPITSTGAKYMSLKQLHNRFTLKQGPNPLKEHSLSQAFGRGAAVESFHRRADSEPAVLDLLRKESNIVTATSDQEYDEPAGLLRNGFGLVDTVSPNGHSKELTGQEVTDHDLAPGCVPMIAEGSIVIELHISEPENAEEELQQLAMQVSRESVGEKSNEGEPCAEETLLHSKDESVSLRKERLCKGSPRAVVLAEALQKYNLQKASVSQWKEYELGGILPTLLVSHRCKIYWPLDDEWYPGVIQDYNEQTRKHLIVYQDGEREWPILAKERVKLKISAAEKLQLTLESDEQVVDGKRRLDPDELAALAVTREDFQEDPGPGDLVWAKVKGYPMWPAYVMDEDHARACGLELTTRNDMLAVQFFGSYDYARIVSRNVVLFSMGLLSKYQCKCKRVAFDQGLQEVEVYLKECRLPESMVHLHIDYPESIVGIECKRRDVDGDDHDFMGDERKYTIRKSMKSLFTLPLKLGSLVVLNLGKIVRNSEHFHDQHHIWTEGYMAVRKFTLSKDSNSAVEYLMEVGRNPRFPLYPLFRVTAKNEMMPIEGSSPYACWKKLFKKLKKLEEKGGSFTNSPDLEKRRRFRSGAAMFGFSNPRVSKLIQDLPHAGTCSKYTGWLNKPLLEEGQEDLLPAGYQPVEVQWKHLDRCTICYLDEEFVDNLLLQCDKCGIMVHMKCYGQLELPEGDLWLCSLCDTDAPKRRPLCCLCPVTSGSMKRTTDGRWAHLTCAVWMPETRMVDTKRMEPIDCVNAIHKERWSLTCSVCRVPYGACIQCGDSHCRVAYHPLCARASSFRMEAVEETKKDGEVFLRVMSYCSKHRRSKAQTQINQDVSPPQDSSFFQPPVNPSGCARSEPYVPATRHGHREPEAQAAAHAKQQFMENMPFLVSGRRCGNLPKQQESSFKVWSWPSEVTTLGCSFSNPHVDRVAGLEDDIIFSMSDKFHHMISSLKQRLTFGKSAIHRWGVFSKQTHRANDMIIEYAGEVVRPIIADLREARCYDSLVGAGTYMFRVDDDRVVDATNSGSLAHLINHSCEPNCYSRLISVRGKERIIIFAKREILFGEELTYDYRFMSKDERLDCLCRCRSCRGTVNILDDGSEPSTTLLSLKDLVKWEPPSIDSTLQGGKRALGSNWT